MKENTFGKFIRTKRLERNLTLEKVARALGRSIPYIHDLEAGNRKPPVRTPEKFVVLAQYLNVPLELLLEKAGISLDSNNKNYIKVIKNRAVATYLSNGLERLRTEIEDLERSSLDSIVRKKAKKALETLISINAYLESAE